MPETFKKVVPGDPFVIPAALYNRLVDIASEHGNPEQTVDSSALFRQTGIIRIKNASGADRARFEVLGIDNVLITPTDNLEEFKQRVLLNGSTPATGGEGKFAVLLEPIRSNEIGRAVAAGLTAVQINMTDSAHKFAEISDGDTAKLVSGTTGSARIMWAESGTGTKWAIIRIDG